MMQSGIRAPSTMKKQSTIQINYRRRRWKVSGSVVYTSVGATLRGYTVVVPTDASLAATDYEVAIGQFQILNQNSANATNEPLKVNASTLSRTDMIVFQ